MSVKTAVEDVPQRLHDHDGVHGEQAGHGTLRGYLIGFGLAVILTVIPFLIVMGDVFTSPRLAAFVVMAFALAQIIVHMVYFLHMNSRSEGGWTMMALIFTIVLVVITLSGSIWIMYHLNTNMMLMPHDMRSMP